MSLYNMMCGNNPLYQIYLAMLATEGPINPPRFRDVYIADDDGEARIVVYTRTGGGNRDYYQEENANLASHPLYVSDFDDDFDCTFAHWKFRVPEKFAASVREVQELLSGAPKLATPREKFDRAMEGVKGESGSSPAMPSDDNFSKATSIIEQWIEDLGLIQKQSA